MVVMRKGFMLLLVGLWGFALGAASAQANEVEFDHHVVHYTVINTTFLTPEVARAYNIRRSGNRALINVVVLERDTEEMRSVPATLTGQAVNLNQQVRHLQFRAVRDGDAIYHLAELQVRPGEQLDFQLRILAEGRDEILPIRFSQTFYRR